MINLLIKYFLYKRKYFMETERTIHAMIMCIFPACSSPPGLLSKAQSLVVLPQPCMIVIQLMVFWSHLKQQVRGGEVR